MREFTRAGGSIIFYSTDATEVANLSDRVVVMYRGRVAAEFRGGQITEEAIMQVALGNDILPKAKAIGGAA